MAKESKRFIEAILEAIELERTGRDFYIKASNVASEPRAKNLFERLANDELDHIRVLNIEYDNLKRNDVFLSPAEVRQLARTRSLQKPRIYPVEAVHGVECFVCGYVPNTDEKPESCPVCGAAEYAFEKDITLSMAIKTSIDTEKKTIAFYTKLAKELKNVSEDGRRVIEEINEIEREHLATLEKELSRH